MADLLEQIESDREAGTPGPWLIPDKSSLGCIENQGGEIIAETYGIGENCSGYDADARRIARVPEMEAILLEQAAKLEAAEAMAEALGQIAKEAWKTKVNPDKIFDIAAATHATWKEANNERRKGPSKRGMRPCAGSNPR